MNQRENKDFEAQSRFYSEFFDPDNMKARAEAYMDAELKKIDAKRAPEVLELIDNERPLRQIAHEIREMIDTSTPEGKLQYAFLFGRTWFASSFTPDHEDFDNFGFKEDLVGGLYLFAESLLFVLKNFQFTDAMTPEVKYKFTEAVTGYKQETLASKYSPAQKFEGSVNQGMPESIRQKKNEQEQTAELLFFTYIDASEGFNGEYGFDDNQVGYTFRKEMTQHYAEKFAKMGTPERTGVAVVVDLIREKAKYLNDFSQLGEAMLLLEAVVAVMQSRTKLTDKGRLQVMIELSALCDVSVYGEPTYDDEPHIAPSSSNHLAALADAYRSIVGLEVFSQIDHISRPVTRIDTYKVALMEQASPFHISMRDRFSDAAAEKRQLYEKFKKAIVAVQKFIDDYNKQDTDPGSMQTHEISQLLEALDVMTILALDGDARDAVMHDSQAGVPTEIHEIMQGLFNSEFSYAAKIIDIVERSFHKIEGSYEQAFEGLTHPQFVLKPTVNDYEVRRAFQDRATEAGWTYEQAVAHLDQSIHEVLLMTRIFSDPRHPQESRELLKKELQEFIEKVGLAYAQVDFLFSPESDQDVVGSYVLGRNAVDRLLHGLTDVYAANNPEAINHRSIYGEHMIQWMDKQTDDLSDLETEFFEILQRMDIVEVSSYMGFSENVKEILDVLGKINSHIRRDERSSIDNVHNLMDNYSMQFNGAVSDLINLLRSEAVIKRDLNTQTVSGESLGFASVIEYLEEMKAQYNRLKVIDNSWGNSGGKKDVEDTSDKSDGSAFRRIMRWMVFGV